MRLPRSLLVSVAFAAGLAAGLALVGPQSGHAGPAEASASPVRAATPENVLIATPLSRVLDLWAHRSGDDRTAHGVVHALLPAAFTLALLAVLVAAAGVTTTARRRALALAPVRGPPHFELL